MAADFKLTVDIEVDKSFEKMKGSLDTLVSKLNQNPPKIKFDLDINREAIDKFTKEIRDIQKTIGKLGTISISSVGASGVSDVAKGVSQLSQNVQNVKPAIREMRAELNSVNTDKIREATNSINGMTAKGVEEIARSLSDVEVRVDKVRASLEETADIEQTLVNLQIKGVSTAGDTAGQMVEYLMTFDTETGKISKKVVNISSTFKDVQTSIRDVNNLYTQMHSLIRKNDNATGTTSYDELANGAKVLQDALSLVESEGISVDEAFARLGTSGAAAIENAKNAMSAFRREVEETGTSGTTSITRLLNIYTSAQKLIEDNAGSKDIDEYSTLKEQIKSVESAINTAKESGITFEQAISEAGIDVIKTFEKISSAIAKLKAATATRQNSESKIEKDTKEYYDALKKIDSLRRETQEHLNKWTKAEKGESSGAYAALKTYIADLDYLENNLREGKISPLKLNEEIAKLKTNIQSADTAIKSAGEDTETWWQKIKKLSTKFSEWFSVSRVIIAVYNACKKMVTSVIELDTAMTELKKVTDETTSSYDAFLDRAANRTKKLGASLSDTVTATADFARLGYTVEEAEELSDAAIIYKNVGDGISDISEASESIIATMQAFGIEADEATSIVDKFNEVGNNYAISSEGIGEALLRSAATMKAAGNTLDQTIALTAAANTIVQNPESVGTTLKTVSMYLRAAKTEAEEAGESTDGMANSVSELRDEILALTGNKVDIQIDENTYKSTYDILKELSEVWENLTDITKANITELVGGKRNSNVVSAILENFSVAEKALETSANSAGSAMEENEKYLNSIQGRIEIMKASFEELAQNIISSDLVRFFVDAANKLLEFVNLITEGINTLGGLKTILIAVSGTLLSINLSSITTNINNIFNKLNSVRNNSTLLANIYNFITSYIESGRHATGVTARLSRAFKGLGSSIDPVQVKIGAATAAITVAVAAYSAWRNEVEQQRQATIDAAKASVEESKNIMDLYTAYQSANAAYESNSVAKEVLEESTEALLLALGYEASAIDNLREKYGDLDAAINNVTYEALTDAANDAKDGLQAAYKNVMDKFGMGGEISSNIAAAFNQGTSSTFISWLEDTEELNDKVTKILHNADISTESGKYYNNDASLSNAVFNLLTKERNGTITLSPSIKSIDDIYEAYNKAIEARDALRAGLSNEEYSNSEAVSQFTDRIKKYELVLNDYTDAVNTANEAQAKADLFNILTEKGVPETIKGFEGLKNEFMKTAEESGKYSLDLISDDDDSALSTLLDNTLEYLENVFPGLSDIREKAKEVADSTSQNYKTACESITQSTNEASKSVESLSSGITAVQEVLNSQQAGKSISYSDFNSEELKDYQSALEYVNGTMQLNAEKVSEIAKAKAEEQIVINNTNKALEQAKYIENAKEIAKYRKKLKELGDDKEDEKEKIEASIDALLEENSAIVDTCKQYDLLSVSLREAVDAYHDWLNAQNSSDYGDMADDAVTAIQRIRDTYDVNSDIYGDYGSKKFAAAVDFIVPDSVDKDDLAAIEKYMSDFKQHLTFNDDGTVEGLNIDKFLKNAVDAGLMTYSEDDGFKTVAGVKMEDFAEGLELSSGAVQAFFDELQLKGAKFDWSDEAVKTIGDLAVEAGEAAESLRKIEGNSDLEIKIDVSDIEGTDEQIKALDDTIREMNGVKAKPNVDSSEVESANKVIQYCIKQKQLLSQPDIMRVDTSQVEGDIGDAIKLLQQFQEANDDLELKTAIGADTTDAQAKVDELAKQIQGISPDIKTALTLDTTSVESINTSIREKITPEILVTAGIDASAIDGYNPDTKETDVIYNPDTSLLPTSFDPLDRTVKYIADTKDLPERFTTLSRKVKYYTTGDAGGKISVNGTAHTQGTAKAGGDWGTAPGGRTLVGELGREIVVNPHTGRWYTVGDTGAEFVNVPRGAIVFNHIQTEDLLKNGYVSGRASALASGTAMVTMSYKPYTASSSSTSRKSSSSSSSKSSSSSSKSSSKSSSSTKEAESEFERLYKKHQHLVVMDIESQEDFLKWLNTAYKDAYKKNEIELDDYYKYQEEVYDGLHDLVEDHLDDVEHEISMRENYGGDSKKVVSLYNGLIKEVEKDIAKARAQGLDDTDEYIQELQSRWQGYKDAKSDILNDAKDEAKNAVDELIDYRIDMIKQDLENEKDALNDKLDNLKDFYDKQKEMLQDKYDEEKYLDEQAEKRKSVSDIQSEIAMLENDDSAWAQKRKLELQEELADAQDELNDFEKDHALDMALDTLDDAYETQASQIESKIEALEEKLNDPHALYNQALSEIKNNTGNLYSEMITYNRKYGTGNDEDVKELYEEAYAAQQKNKDVNGKYYKGIVLKNSTNYKVDTSSWDTEKVSDEGSKKKQNNNSNTNKTTTTTPKLTKGTSITVKKTATHFASKSNNVKMASSVPGGSYTVYNTSGNQVLIGRKGVYTGWIKKTDIVGYAKGTSNATAGLHSIDELGSEYLFTSKDGTNYRVLNDGDKVLNAKATDFLYKFANSGEQILEKIIKSIFDVSSCNNIQPIVNNNEINMGDIIVQGSATQQTVSEIRRAQRESLTDMIKSLNKLNA